MDPYFAPTPKKEVNNREKIIPYSTLTNIWQIQEKYRYTTKITYTKKQCSLQSSKKTTMHHFPSRFLFLGDEPVVEEQNNFHDQNHHDLERNLCIWFLLSRFFFEVVA
jgi:hypothetical protein